ncbi:MAG: HD domain-containing protein [Alphaproteobacteria bacterium]|nr:HD domain-containing protein [Alphaproteobacteria bacterium]
MKEGQYTERLDEALVLAHRLHRAQTRKAKPVPYIGHLLGVASIVITEGGDEDQVIAALLHDAIEDQGDKIALADIEARFGPRVATIVAACTDAWEKPKPPWRARKEAYLAALPSKPEAVRLVALADKIHNLEEILEDHARVGAAVWTRFNAPPAELAWYYRGLADAFLTLRPGPLADRFAVGVARLEAVV